MRHFIKKPGAVSQWAGLLLVIAVPISGTGGWQSTTQTLDATVSPYGNLSVPGTVNLLSGGTQFATALAGSITICYWARTSSAGGSVTVEADSDFSPEGGPSIGTVAYLCSGATLGTGCSGAQTLSTTTQTPLVSLPGGVCTGGGGACSSQAPNTVLVSLSGLNEPHYKTGTYSAQITFTISTM